MTDEKTDSTQRWRTESRSGTTVQYKEYTDKKRIVRRQRKNSSHSRPTSGSEILQDLGESLNWQQAGLGLFPNSGEQDDSSESDPETDMEEEESDFQQVDPAERGRRIYISACRKCGAIPSTHVIKGLARKRLNASYKALTPEGAKALCTPLLVNTEVTELTVAGNCLGARGLRYVVDMMSENVFISKLDVSENQLGTRGALCLRDLLLNNFQLRTLTAAGNNFRESDAHHFAQAIEQNWALTELNLSHNHFQEEGGVVLAQALANNDTLKKLDLSWNHLRMRGASAVAEMLKNNQTLTHLNLAYNGFDDDGAIALAEALADNSTLTFIDLSNNRIGIRGAITLAEALKKNNTLQTLRLTRNPITTEGAIKLLRALHNNKESAVNSLDLRDIPVTYDCEAMIQEVQSERPLTVHHGGHVTSADVYGLRLASGGVEEADPFSLILAYCKVNGLRLWDMFAQMDSDCSMAVSRQEFISGIQRAKIPITHKKLMDLVEKLDEDKDGSVDFGELMRGRKDFIVRQRKKLPQKDEDLKLAESTPETSLPPLTRKH